MRRPDRPRFLPAIAVGPSAVDNADCDGRSHRAARVVPGSCRGARCWPTSLGAKWRRDGRQLTRLIRADHRRLPGCQR